MEVSVITPTTLSRRRFWPDAIHSYVNQTYSHKELILIVDNETERSELATLVNSIAPAENITILEYPGLTTLGDKRNFACEAARGIIICHMDDDDLSSPNRLADQVAMLERSGKAVTGYTDAMVHELRTVSIRAEGEWRRTSGWYQMHADELLGGSLAYLKSWWIDHSFKSVNLGEDTAFITAASNESQVVLSSNGLDHYCIRNHHTNTSGRCITDDCIEVAIADGGLWAHNAVE